MKPLRPQGSHRALWPDGKSFAFTVFDDPDSQTLEAGREVYAFLASLGFRTTKGVWPIRGSGTPSDHGGTCAEPAYRAWVQDLQRKGFEIGLHNATLHTSDRQPGAPVGPADVRGILRRVSGHHGPALLLR